MEFLSKRTNSTNVKIGDFVKACDITKNQDVYRKVLNVMHPVVERANQISFSTKSGGYLSTSTKHPTAVITSDGIIYKQAGEVSKLDELVKEGSTSDAVLDIIKPNGDENFIDFSIDDTENYYAGLPMGPLLLAHNSATFNFPMWHLEFESLIELKNNKGSPETRLQVVDYAVGINKTMYERLLAKSHITLFSPDEVPDLYEAYYGPADEFKVLYEKYEADPRKTKKTLPAVDVFTKLVTERFGTGRIYIVHTDHVNTHGSFLEKTYMTNLCCEITLPTTPMGEDDSLIALCTLSALNWGKIQSEEEMVEASELAVRGLDELLDYQDYPNKAAERHTKKYRPLGIGIINLAYDMVKNDKSWSDPTSLDWVEAKTESMAYWLTAASAMLAKEKGSCEARNKYSDGIVPMDSAIGGTTPNLDWENLREKLRHYGIRNSTLMAMMPSETSSQLANATNGIEPPRALIITKGNKDASSSQVVPEYARYNHAYELSWDISVPDYLQVMARIQKYTDQAISINENYNPSKGEVTVKTLLQNLLLAYKVGTKTLYYCNTMTDGEAADDGCESGACKI